MPSLTRVSILSWWPSDSANPMPAFTYTALNPTGQQLSGKLQAGSRAEAFRRLESQALTPVRVLEESAAPGSAKALAAQAAADALPVRLKRPQLILFTEELADLLDGGLMIDQALRVMEERQESVAVRRIAGTLRNELREGSTVSKALKKASPSFDDLYINLVSAGEVSGSLPDVLRRLAANLTVIQELQSKVTSAMIYPAMLVIACIGLLIVFMTVLVPQLTSLLEGSGKKLPMATQMLMDFTRFFQSYWWAMLAFLVVFGLSFKSYIATANGRLWWHRTRMTLPLFGPVIATRFYAQFASSMGNLISNGIPLLNGLKLSTRATDNVFLQGLLTRVVGMVGEGASLSNALRKVGHFPSLLVDMIAVGETTGTLGRSLEKTALRYDKELDKRIKRLITFISPAIMIFMAVIVGTVAYSIVTAILETSQGIRSQG